jgi:hypothetical protein
VTFLYVQDTPAVNHGPTIFVPNTNNPESHASYFTAQDSSSSSLDETSAKCATLCTGDAVIYDASVLHFGGAKSAPNNTRVVLYFGVGLKRAAVLLLLTTRGLLRTWTRLNDSIHWDKAVYSCFY